MGLIGLSYCLVLATTALASSIPRQTDPETPVAPTANILNISQETRNRWLEVWRSHADRIISDDVPEDEVGEVDTADYEEYEYYEGEDEDELSGEVDEEVLADVDGMRGQGAWETARSQLVRQVRTDPSKPPIPRFMLELYEKFGRDRHAHPISNIVRSFVTQDTATSRQPRSTRRFTIHHVSFNLTSLQPHEDVYLAELRLYCVLHGHPTAPPVFLVYVYERSSDAENQGRRLVAFRKITIKASGWEIFPLTEAVYRWMENRDTGKRFEIHVMNYMSHLAAYSDVSMSIVTSLDDEDQPMLLVFSDDRNQQALHARERQEIVEHELATLAETPREETNRTPKSRLTKRDTYNTESMFEDETTEWDDEGTLAEDLYSNGNNLSTDALEELQGSVRTTAQYNMTENDLFQSRIRRAKSRSRRRNPCHRKPLIVNFSDIGWDWIIQPQSYQAYECTGRCYFPIPEALSPTKHAIITTLVHTMYPWAAGRACCVPTRLAAISVLYLEHGSFTYKYQYDGMKVEACGCR